MPLASSSTLSSAPSSAPRLRPADLVAAALALALGGSALAGPEGSQTVRGNVTITKQGDETVIRASDRSIINHRSFDIATTERVRFIQPGADARVLNRITGAAPTRIDGALTANGRVYIVNPAGVVFGRTATVDVAGLFAAAGKLSDADFVSGVDRVTNMTGRVANEGTIRAARNVTLTGSQVANLGTIVSPQGSVALAAGENIVVSDRGSTMFVRVDGAATGDGATAGVTNTGIIDTSSPQGGGRVILAAGDVYGLAIKHTGSISGAGVQLQGAGRGDVVVDGGTISARNQRVLGAPRTIDNWQSPPVSTPRATARGETRRSRTGAGVTIADSQPTIPNPQPQTLSGGSITIAGDRIAVFNSTFDASGNAGGGQVKLGGDIKGADFAHDPSLQKANALAVNQDTILRADALEQGSGGQVILFATGTTRTNAAISATGGSQGGDGGFVETSGKQHLDVRGDRIDAHAKHISGKAGLWLIDPRNVTIDNSTTAGGSFNAGTPDIFTPTSDSSVIAAIDIANRLNAGTSVTINTGSDGSQAGNIALNADIALAPSVTAPVTLRLEAANDIVVADNVILGAPDAAYTIELLANTVTGASTDLDASAGSLLLGDNVVINANGGDIRLAGVNIGIGLATTLISNGGDISLSAASSITTANGDSFTTNGGDLFFSAPTLNFGTTTLDHSVTAGVSTATTTLRSNSIDLSNITFTGDGSLALETRSPGVTIAVGTGAAGSYLLSDADLTTLAATDFSTVTIGRSTSGLLTTANGVDFSSWSSNLRLRGTTASLGDLTLSGGPFLALNFSGALVQTGDLTVNNLVLETSGPATLTSAGNQISSLSGSASGGLELVTTGVSLNVQPNAAAGTTSLTLGATSSLTNTSAAGIFVSAPITISAGTTTLTAADVDVGATVSGPGSLTLQPLSAGDDIRIGSPGVPSGFVIRSNDLPQFSSTLASLTIGRADGTGTLTIDGATALPVTSFYRMGGAGGRIVVANALSTTGAEHDLALLAPGGITLGSNLSTQGGVIGLTGLTTLAANVLLDTTNAGASTTGNAIFVNNALDADSQAANRTLTARVGTTGSLVAADSIGATAAIGSLLVEGGGATINSVRTTGNQIYNAVTTVSGSYTSLNSGVVVFGNQVLVGGPTTITTAGASGDDILFADAVLSTANHAFTANAGAGTVSAKQIAIGGPIALTGALVRLDGDLAGSALDITGPALLQRDITITATNAARFTSTINSEATETNDLTINSATALLLGDIGQATDGALGSLITDIGGVATIGAARITVANDLGIGDNLTLSSNLEARAGALAAFRGTIDGAFSLNVVADNDGVIFANKIGDGAALTSLVAGGSTISLGGSIRTIGAQTYNADVLLTDDVQINASGVDFASTIDSQIAPRNFIVNANAGAVNFNAALGSLSALRSMDITGGTITANGARTTGAQRYAGTARILGDFSSTENGSIEFANDVLLRGTTSIASAGATTTQGISFRGRIQSSATSNALTANARGGALRFEGEVGPGSTGVVAPSTLTASGSSIDILQNITTTGSQLYTGTTSLRGNLSISGTGSIGLAGATVLLSDATLTTTAGDIIFGSTLNSDDTARVLSVNTGGSGTTRFSGAVGATNRLSSLTTNADGTTILSSSQIRTINDQIYNDAVRLGTNMTLEANDVVFASTLNSDSPTTTRNLIVNTATISGDAGDTTFTGRVGGLARIGSLTTNADGTTRIGADISTSRAITFNDSVLLLNSATIDASNAPIFFRTTLDADTTATDPNLTLLSSAAGDLDTSAFRFGASVGGTRRLGGLTLGADRGSPARAASIVFSDAFDSQGRVQLSGVASTDTFNVITGNNGFTMGAGHKITSFGSLRITSNGTISVGDITALGAIVLNGNAINVRRRPGAEVRLRDRSLTTDTGVDFVSGGAIDFTRVPNQTGSGLAPTFTAGNGQVDAELSGFISRTPLTPLALTDFQDPTNSQVLLALDQRSLGATRTIISDDILMPTPPIPVPPMVTPRNVAAADLALLAELGIPVQPETLREQADNLSGRSFDDRLPLSGFLPSSVPASRLTPRATSRLACAYRELALEPLTDAAGSPVLDDAGQPRTVSRMDTLRDLLGDSWQRYVAESAAKTTGGSGGGGGGGGGAGWRRTLESAGSTGDARDRAALAALNQARQFLLALDDLGLAPASLEVPRAKVLGELLPASMPDLATLEEAILGTPRLTVMR
jgi:filamentous hemagglutinin family protein